MRLRTLLPVCCCLALLGGACTSSTQDDIDPADFQPDPAAVAPSGDSCTDGTGDLLVDTEDTGKVRSEPGGIDITLAEAVLDDDDLTLHFTTVQPIESAPDPLFLAQHGDLVQSPSLSWEVRLEQDEGAWTATLITVPPVGREVPTTLSAPVVVDGNDISVVIPRDDLPQISARLWSFGSSAGIAADNRIFDECVPFAQDPTGSTAPPASSGPTVTAPPVVGPLGSPLDAPDGARVTVHLVEAPAVPDEGVDLQAVPGTQLVTADVEVCATDRQLDDVGASRWVVTLDDGDTRSAVSLRQSPHPPQFPVGVTLRPGECERGWVTFQTAADVGVVSVAYDVSGVGVGPLVISET